MFPSTDEITDRSLTNAAEVPRDHDSDDDSSHDFVISVPRNREIELALEQIEDRIEAIDRRLAACAPLVSERQRLFKARAVLLDEPLDSHEGNLRPRRVTREDVAAAVEAAPGSRAGELARVLGTSQPAISAHLYRGRTDVFENRGGRWYLRVEPISA